MVNGNMIAGFALLATRGSYGRSGVMTSMVNQAGTVYEKDPGPYSAALAERIIAFDPDGDWAVVNDLGS